MMIKTICAIKAAPRWIPSAPVTGPDIPTRRPHNLALESRAPFISGFGKRRFGSVTNGEQNLFLIFLKSRGSKTPVVQT
jgi:hypothetical protein